jgi:hypothetical protein
MSEDTSEKIYIGCQCTSAYHIVCVSFYDWMGDEPPELYFELQADRDLGLWDRLKAAVRYVFGQENLGWHDVIPNHEDVLNLKRVVDKYNDAYVLYNKREDEING